MSALARTNRRASRPWPAPGVSPGAIIPAATERSSFDRLRADLDHAALMARAGRILGVEIRYIAHSSFDDPQARAAILAPLPPTAVVRAPRRIEAPEGLAPYWTTFDDDGPLLSREQEAHLFRKMNYLLHRAARRRERIDPSRPCAVELDEIERELSGALAIKSQIVRANLRLVVALAKRYVLPDGDLAELVSDGNFALVRAVDRFDFSRGNKFSTYATWTIRHEFSQSMRRKARHHRLIRLASSCALEYAGDSRMEQLEQSDARAQREAAVARWVEQLDRRARHIIVGHYGIGGAAKRTLAQIGQELGISKERVRQIELEAREDLRKLAHRDECILLRA